MAPVAGGTCGTPQQTWAVQSCRCQMSFNHSYPGLNLFCFQNQSAQHSFKAFILLILEFAKDESKLHEPSSPYPWATAVPSLALLWNSCREMNRSLTFPHEVKQQSPLPRQSLLFFQLWESFGGPSLWIFMLEDSLSINQKLKSNLDVMTFYQFI